MYKSIGVEQLLYTVYRRVDRLAKGVAKIVEAKTSGRRVASMSEQESSVHEMKQAGRDNLNCQNSNAGPFI
jgi:hypothetical protein